MQHDVYPPAQVRAEDREMAFSVAMRPRYVLAKNHWTGAEPASRPPGFDYEDLVATVCLEADEHLRVVESSSGKPNAEFDRTLVIDIPDAELWIVAKGTVVGVDAAGALQRLYLASGDRVKIRDDSSRLRAIAKLAIQWHGVPRYAGNVAINRLAPSNEVGWLIQTVTGGSGQSFDVNSCVTKRAWDFVEGRTELDTEWWGLDWKRIAPVNLAGYPDHKAVLQGVSVFEKAFMNAMEWLR